MMYFLLFSTVFLFILLQAFMQSVVDACMNLLFFLSLHFMQVIYKCPRLSKLNAWIRGVLRLCSWIT